MDSNPFRSPVLYTSIIYKGRDTTFVLWPGISREEDWGDIMSMAVHLRDTFNEQRGSLQGGMNGIDSSQLGFERPIGIIKKTGVERPGKRWTFDSSAEAVEAEQTFTYELIRYLHEQGKI